MSRMCYPIVNTDLRLIEMFGVCSMSQLNLCLLDSGLSIAIECILARTYSVL